MLEQNLGQGNLQGWREVGNFGSWWRLNENYRFDY